MTPVKQAVRFIANHDIYNAGEVATFERDEAERLIMVGAAVPDTGEAPQPDTEQTFVPQKDIDKQNAARKHAGAGAEQVYDDDDPRSLKSRQARDDAAARLEEADGDGQGAVREKAFGKDYSNAREHGIVDPAREQALHRPAPPAAQPARSRPFASEVEEARKSTASAPAGKRKGGKKGRKAKRSDASKAGARAAAAGTAVRGGGKAPNTARDTRTEMRNRGEGLGPASPKESTNG